MPVTLTLVRGRQKTRRDRKRAYRVMVDGSRIAKVKHGQTVKLELSPGPHDLSLKIDWCSSNRVALDVKEGDEVHMTCGPRGGNVTLVTDALFRFRSYLRLDVAERRDSSEG
jgi:hypothetical protein